MYSRSPPNSALNSAKSKKRTKTGMRKGVLDGIPISVKDLADIEGHLTQVDLL